MYIGKIETGRSYKKIIILFVVASLILIAFVVYNSFSRAEITLTPKKETEKVEFEVPIEKKENITTQSALLGRVLVTTLEEKQKITDIAKKQVDDKAQGKVIIYNKRGESQTLKPRTQLQSEKTGLIFRTDQRVVIPGGGQVEVGVTSDEVGEKTNIEPDRFNIVKIWKDWQSLIYAESKEKMTGGIREARVATQAEIDRAKEKVANDLKQKALDSFKKELQNGEQILENATAKEIINSQASCKPDTRTEEFEMYVKVKVAAVVFDEKSLFDLALARLKKGILENKEFVSFDQKSFTYSVQSYDEKNEAARIKVSLSGTSIYKISSSILDKEKLIGRNAEEVKLYFKKNPDIENIKVSFSPFWVKTVPSLKDHIEIIVEK
jgi:hypothetical protein